MSLCPKFMRDPAVQINANVPCDGKLSLARLQVVEQVLGDFAKQIMTIRHEFVSGKPGGFDAIARIESAAEDCGRIFLGKNEAFKLAPGATPGRMNGLFRYFADASEVMKRREAPATAFFVSAAKIVVAGCEQLERGERADSDVDAELKRYFQSVAARLVGREELPA
jgi:hypothetical protein